MIRRFLVLLLTGFLSSAQAQDLRQVEEQTRRLVAMVEARWQTNPNQPYFGAAIIVAHRQNHLYLVTCRHVVRHGSENQPQDAAIKLQLRWLPGKDVNARVTQSNLDLDLALLEADDRDLNITSDTLLFSALPVDPEIGGETPVWLVGNPHGKAWDAQPSPDWVPDHVDSDWIHFKSDFLASGHSGGALVDEKWRLLGINRDEAPPIGRALRIQKVIEQIHKWDKPVDLSTGLDTGPPKLVTISATKGEACGLTETGHAYCWTGEGENTAVPEAGRLRFKNISVGDGDICAVTLAGEGYCWGGNRYGRLGIGRNENKYFDDPIPVLGNHLWSEFFTGPQHTCGITVDREAFCWGFNLWGRLGNGSNEDQNVPALVAGGLRWRSLSLGPFSTCGVTIDGRGYCWGWGDEGHIGNGRLKSTAVPVSIVGELRFKSIVVGRQSRALDTEGRLYGWGGETAAKIQGDQAAVPKLFPGDQRYRAISHYGECGIAMSGELDCWESDIDKPSFDPSLRFEDISRNDSGDSTTCVLTTTKEAFCWPQGLGGVDGTGGAGDTEHPYPVLLNICKHKDDDEVEEKNWDFESLQPGIDLPKEKAEQFGSTMLQNQLLVRRLNARWRVCHISKLQFDSAVQEFNRLSKLEDKLSHTAGFSHFSFDPNKKLTPSELKEALQLIDEYTSKSQEVWASYSLRVLY